MNRVMVGLGLIAALALASNAAAGQKKDDDGAGKKTTSAVVNINSATPSELQTLPGIGARTAQRIVEYRQKNGGFKEIEEPGRSVNRELFWPISMELPPTGSLWSSPDVPETLRKSRAVSGLVGAVV